MTASSPCSNAFSSDRAAFELPVESLSQVITDILATGCISRSSQSYLLEFTRSNESLSMRDVVLINRVFQRLQSGLLRVVED